MAEPSVLDDAEASPADVPLVGRPEHPPRVDTLQGVHCSSGAGDEPEAGAVLARSMFHQPVHGAFFHINNATVNLCTMPSSCSWVKLLDVLRAQVAMVEAQGDARDERATRRIRLVICADATPMWRTSATRCDVFLDMRQSTCV